MQRQVFNLQGLAGIFIQLNTRLCSWKYRQLHSTILLTSRKNNAAINHYERPSIGLSAASRNPHIIVLTANNLPIRPGHLARVRHLSSNIHQGPGSSPSQSPHDGPPSSRHSFQSQTKSNSRFTLDPIHSRSTSSSTGRSSTRTSRTSSCSGRSCSCTGRTPTLSRTTGRITGRTTSRITGCTTNLNSSCPSSSRSPEKCQAVRETSV
ncbi:hypothetical protein BZA05DRAFT_381139 [Tricharina praecox]|uniref:uncharacterized protein n=1 Tax=Tricharina praecox TaxID=43433 RepID=UPI0022208019|nr:uncharacterized protein BZA05DRAFT_381139 [Tricharina praecox]KAI5858416.1 hypothetical protein BZA05DRAFT_381139 [Tricharina praecox]